jgi:hypothetical protein
MERFMGPGIDRRATAPARVGPPPVHETAVPAQDRVWGDQAIAPEDRRQPPDQGDEDRSVAQSSNSVSVDDAVRPSSTTRPSTRRKIRYSRSDTAAAITPNHPRRPITPVSGVSRVLEPHGLRVPLVVRSNVLRLRPRPRWRGWSAPNVESEIAPIVAAMRPSGVGRQRAPERSRRCLARPGPTCRPGGLPCDADGATGQPDWYSKRQA